jgi:hypothetical protein
VRVAFVGGQKQMGQVYVERRLGDGGLGVVVFVVVVVVLLEDDDGSDGVVDVDVDKTGCGIEVDKNGSSEALWPERWGEDAINICGCGRRELEVGDGMLIV